jgi:Na+/H+ antiporter NhaD/arsenite permease-like protein
VPATNTSALFVNDTICVMFTPLVVSIVEEAALPALPFLLALATSTNLGGVATYTGNPQNMIIGTHAGMSFGRYLLRMLPVAALGLLVDAALLLLLFRRELPHGRLPPPAEARPTLDRALVGKSLFALAVALCCFLAGYSMAGSALAAAALLVVLAGRPPAPILARVDFPLLLFFGALFVVVAGVGHAGVLDRAYGWMMARLDPRPGPQLFQFSAITTLGSNLFSNVPWVLLSLDAVPRLADPERGWLTLAMASTLAGNLTIFGSVANLIVLELAGKHGRVGFLRFFKYGLVITTVTMAIGLAVILIEGRLGL